MPTFSHSHLHSIFPVTIWTWHLVHVSHISVDHSQCFFYKILIRRIIITDEEDVHQCGRCKEIFHSIDEYFVHKSSKVCKKPKKPPQAEPPQAEPSDTSVVASNVSETQVMSRKFSERKFEQESVPVECVLPAC